MLPFQKAQDWPIKLGVSKVCIVELWRKTSFGNYIFSNNFIWLSGFDDRTEHESKVSQR